MRNPYSQSARPPVHTPSGYSAGATEEEAKATNVGLIVGIGLAAVAVTVMLSRLGVK